MYAPKTLPVATAYAHWTAAANAQATTDGIITMYEDLGFQYIEIKEGITQTKVEAIMADGRKVEVIYDNETGQILKQETERADADEIGRVGIEIDQEDEDFLDDEDDDEEDDDDENDEDDEDDEDDDDDEDDEDDDEDDNDDGDEDDGEDDDSEDDDES